MNWILSSFLMLVFSNIYYLVLRKAQLNNMGNNLYMVANYATPTLIYLGINIATGTSLFVTSSQIGLIILTAFLFSFLPSISSYTAMKLAPNPGYSLVIQKSYAIYTSEEHVLHRFFS